MDQVIVIKIWIIIVIPVKQWEKSSICLNCAMLDHFLINKACDTIVQKYCNLSVHC